MDDDSGGDCDVEHVVVVVVDDDDDDADDNVGNSSRTPVGGFGVVLSSRAV